MSIKLAKQNLNLVIAGMLAATLLGGCGSQPQGSVGRMHPYSSTQSEASGNGISSQSQDTRKVVHTGILYQRDHGISTTKGEEPDPGKRQKKIKHNFEIESHIHFTS